MRARRTDSDQRVNVRLAVFSARYVLDLVDKKDLEVCEKAIEAAEAWLEDPTAAYAANAANAANAAYYAAYAAATAAAYAAAAAANANAAAAAAANANAAATAAANAAAAAASAAAYAADAADAAAAANAAASAADAANAANDMYPLAFLDALLDAWEEAVTKEGEDLYVPLQWEDDALAFVSEYMSDDIGSIP